MRAADGNRSADRPGELVLLRTILGMEGNQPQPTTYSSPHDAIDAAMLWLPMQSVAAGILAPFRDPVPFRLRMLARRFNTSVRTPAAIRRFQLRALEVVHG
ncbi:hypothetical protein [Roseomonas elaeocarpi]|uniref:Uncharacterized protein n=1 Tax=Roseomonas elaeocarpi TaxID=907779 RepID=A0ABV6JZW3_9PROT